MMEGNPNWWNLNNMMKSSQTAASFPPCSSLFDNQYTATTTTTSDSDHTSNNSNSNYADHHAQQEFPQSWSQLLMDGMANDQEENGNHPSHDHELLQGKINNWNQYHHETSLNHLSNLRFLDVDVKESVVPPSILLDGTHGIGRRNINNSSYINNRDDHEQQQQRETLMLDIHTICGHSNSSTSTHVTNDQSFISNSPLGMSSNAKKSVDIVSRKQQITEHGSTSNKMVSTGTGVYKKPRVQSSSQPPLRVRKELGDRITALHQIVCPFGKTDTASVLLESIGYVRFLQRQIQALSSPYLDTSGSSNMRHFHPLSVQGERNYAFHFDHDQEEILEDGAVKDLRSRGLCLVPISCINNINYESGMMINSKGAADFWVTPPPGLGGSGF